MAAQVHLGEHLFEIAQAQRADDSAVEGAVGVGQPPADGDDIFAVRCDPRPADIGAAADPLDLTLEEILLREIIGLRRRRAGIDDDGTVLVEHEDRTHVLGGRGAVEQDQLPDFSVELGQARHSQALDDCLQRQIVEFEIAVDFRSHRRDDVVSGETRSLASLIAAVQLQEAEDCGKAQRDDQPENDERHRIAAAGCWRRS